MPHDSPPELILDAKPTWEGRPGTETACLYWVISRRRLHTFNRRWLGPVDRAGEYWCAPPRVKAGCAGLRSGFATLELPQIAVVSSTRAAATGTFNDGKCDPAGRFLAGSMDDAEIEASLPHSLMLDVH